MKATEHGIEESRAVENMYHMRLMALLQELVRKRGPKGAARVLEIDPKTVAESIRTGRLSRRTRDSLERALQEGVGSAAERQRERNEKLEVSIAKVYRPVVARVIEPPCGPVDGLFITVRFEGQAPPFGRAGPCAGTTALGSWRLL